MKKNVKLKNATFYDKLKRKKKISPLKTCHFQFKKDVFDINLIWWGKKKKEFGEGENTSAWDVDCLVAVPFLLMEEDVVESHYSPWMAGKSYFSIHASAVEELAHNRLIEKPLAPYPCRIHHDQVTTAIFKYKHCFLYHY